MKKENPEGINIWFVVLICGIAFMCAAGIFLLSELVLAGGGRMIENQTYYLLRIFIAFFDVVVGIVFSIILLGHNRTIREMSRDNNLRGEESWRMSFAASNYSMVDFNDNMLLYEQYKIYTDTLKREKNFSFYLSKDDIEIADVLADFDKYTIMTVRVPFRVTTGTNIGAIRISRFKFSRGDEEFRFLPCAPGPNALILRNEANGRDEIAVNLIAGKDDGFYAADKVVAFNRIKLNMTTISLLGVEVSGWTELYFTNPLKLEKDGANLYKITSSQFKISGLPTLGKETKSEV